MDPRSYWRALVARWPLVVAAALLGAVAAWGWSQTQPDVYRATSSVFVTATPGEDTTQLVQGSTYVQSQLQSYTRLALTPTVLAPVIDELDLDTTPVRLARTVEAENPLGTVIIDVTASDGDPVRAAAVANAVTASLREQALELSPESTEGGSALALEVVAVAPDPQAPSAPDRRLVTLTGGAAGGALGVLAALLLHALDTRLRTRRDVEELDDVPLLGTVARHGGVPLLDDDDVRSEAADDLRRVRARVLAASGDELPPAVVTVVAPRDAAAGPVTTLGLALAAAERDLRVLVVDADAEAPRVSGLAGLTRRPGLTDVLAGDLPLDDAVTPWRAGVWVLTAGRVVRDPRRVVAGPGVEAVLGEARGAWDLVVVSTPPVLESPTALDLTGASDGVVVVATAGRTTRDQLLRTVDSLDEVHAEVLGVVLDGVRPDRRRLGGRRAGLASRVEPGPRRRGAGADDAADADAGRAPSPSGATVPGRAADRARVPAQAARASGRPATRPVVARADRAR